jgi:hypothetical protein
VRRLSYPLEKLFLGNVGRMALRRRRHRLHRRTRGKVAKAKPRRRAAKRRGNKSTLRRAATSRGRAGKIAGHSAVRIVQANMLQRVLGRLTR